MRNFGNTSQRPTTDLATYQTYFNSDVPGWQYWDGSAWQNLGSGGSGGVTSVSGTAPIVSSGGATPAISLADTAVTPGTYSTANITVDSKGRLTAASSGSVGVTSVTGTAPISSSGGATPAVSIAITPANDGGAIAKQSASPGTQQTSANINIDGKMVAGTSYLLGSVPVLQSGSIFPSTGLVDGQRYFHTTYRSWFTYNSTEAKWRQDAPGIFGSSFPTVASGDNTVAPNIEVKRIDRSNTVYFWDGTRWLTTQISYFTPPFANPFTLPVTTNPTTISRFDNPETTFDIFIVSLSLSTAYAAGTYDASNYWTYQLYKISSAVTAVGTAQSTWQTGRVTANRYINSYSINSQHTAATAPAFRIDFAKVGSPSDVNTNPPVLAIRYVG